MTDDGSPSAGDSDSPPGTGLETDLELAAIVAVAENGVIGRDGELPWHLPADLRRFKRLTTGHPVILGRVTYESILESLGEPLPDRTSIVLTSRDLETPDGVCVASDPEGALRAAERAARERHDADRIFVAGGATVYETFLPAVDRLFLTEVHRAPAGDTTFEFDRGKWRSVDRDDRDGFSFLEFVRP